MNRVDVDRPTWDDLFFGIANLVSMRSLDAQTKCGAVIVSQTNEILATGYNSFIRDIDDTQLPNLRPEKYPFMIHSEQNAILNCARNGVATKGSKIYINGKPCLNCLQLMYQAGIKNIFYKTMVSPVMNISQDNEYQHVLNLIGDKMTVIEVK